MISTPVVANDHGDAIGAADSVLNALELGVAEAGSVAGIAGRS
ncbi:MAG TPA: hypothetical protein VND23_06135 [Acidimicrobiales bacterium]|nr:hypothetical protein [Acidimicrobiales bacterium]